MLDFNTNYEYQKEPFSSNDSGYKIYSMSDNGYKRYFANDSYNYNFLGKTNKDIFLNKLKEDDKEKEVLKRKIILMKPSVEEARLIIKNHYGSSDSCVSKNDEVENKGNLLKKANPTKNDDNYEVLNTSINNNNYNNTTNNINSKHLYNSSFSSGKNHKPCKNYFYIDQNRITFKDKGNRRIKSFDTNSPLDKNLNMVKTKIFNSVNLTKVNYLSNSRGFKPDEVPRLESENSVITNTIENIALTCPNENNYNKTEVSNINSNSINFTNFTLKKKIENLKLLNSLKLGAKKDNCDNLNITALKTICTEENKKYKDIIVKQTNNNFLRANRLPRLETHQNEVKTNNVKGTFYNKIMGEHYNPFSFASDIRSFKRNSNGQLYNH